MVSSDSSSFKTTVIFPLCITNTSCGSRPQTTSLFLTCPPTVFSVFAPTHLLICHLSAHQPQYTYIQYILPKTRVPRTHVLFLDYRLTLLFFVGTFVFLSISQWITPCVWLLRVRAKIVYPQNCSSIVWRQGQTWCWHFRCRKCLQINRCCICTVITLTRGCVVPVVQSLGSWL